MIRRMKFASGWLLMNLGADILTIGQWLYWAGKPLYLNNRKSRK